jgi:ATP-dependent RNA helicase DDX5/DBP2
MPNADCSSLQRAGLKGTSYTYFTTENARSARELIGILREARAFAPPQLEEMSMFGGSGGRGRPSRAF